MLHPVPDSTEVPRMGYVLGLQTRLFDALCALPEGSTVDLIWLQSVWAELDAEWVRRFWENHKGQRQPWIMAIAAATSAEKTRILTIMQEQHAFRRLYDTPAVHRVREVDWAATPVLKAARSLLRDFYSSCLYASFGYSIPESAGNCDFHRSDFVAGFGALKVCPYCDNYLQTMELDHFLPKDAFPFLSCHPGNLVPSCHDSNKADGHKGDRLPLDIPAAEQALAWFHPYHRTATGVLKVCIEEQADCSLKLQLSAKDAQEQQRVANMDAMFRLAEFWGKDLQGTIRDHIQNVVDELVDESVEATEATVAERLRRWRDRARREIGRHGLVISREAILGFAATSPALVRETLAQYGEDKRTQA